MIQVVATWVQAVESGEASYVALFYEDGRRVGKVTQADRAAFERFLAQLRAGAVDVRDLGGRESADTYVKPL